MGFLSSIFGNEDLHRLLAKINQDLAEADDLILKQRDLINKQAAFIRELMREIK